MAYHGRLKTQIGLSFNSAGISHGLRSSSSSSLPAAAFAFVSSPIAVAFCALLL